MYNIDLSPIRSPNKQKPKISFKLSSPVLKQKQLSENQSIAENPSKVQQKKLIFNQRKIQEKQNIFIPKPIETYSSRMNFESSQLERDFRSISKVKQSQKQPKLMPVNNKQLKKVVQNACEKCQKQQQSYMIADDNIKCCSKCAIEDMKNGKQVRTLSFKSLSENPVTEQQSRTRSLTINVKPPVLENDSALIERIEKNCDELLQMIEKRLDDGRSIKESFMDKRSQLKRHYEKLKEAIQQAIKKDLDNLKREEERELKDVGIRKEETSKNIDELSGIKKRMCAMKVLQKSHSKNTSKKSELSLQLRGYIDKIQTIIQSQCQLRAPLDFAINKDLYDPEMYMATISQGQKVLEWEDFSSFNTIEEFGFN